MSNVCFLNNGSCSGKSVGYFLKLFKIKKNIKKTIQGIWENPEAIFFNTENSKKMTRGRYKVIEPFKRVRLSPNIEMIEKNKILIGQEPVVNRNRLKKNTGTTPRITSYETFWNSFSKTFRRKYLFNIEHSTILFRDCFRKKSN